MATAHHELDAIRPAHRSIDADKVTRNDRGETISVQAKLNYHTADAKRCMVRLPESDPARVYAKRDLTGDTVQGHNIKFKGHEVTVHNGRLYPEAPSLGAHGFQLCKSSTSLSPEDFSTESQIIGRYYDECAELVRKITGATVCQAFDHNVRSATGYQAGKSIEGGNAIQGPAAGIHSDYTLTSAPDRLQQLGEPPKANDTLRKVYGSKPPLSARIVEQGLKSRFMIINVWRNILESPVEAWPLAICDSRTAGPEDLTVFEIHYEDRVGENYYSAPSSKHEWAYFPKMTRDEAILLQTWDSAGDAYDPARGGGAHCIHTAFPDPSMREGAPDRLSLEVRVMCVFDAPPGPLVRPGVRPLTPAPTASSVRARL